MHKKLKNFIYRMRFNEFVIKLTNLPSCINQFEGKSFGTELLVDMMQSLIFHILLGR